MLGIYEGSPYSRDLSFKKKKKKIMKMKNRDIKKEEKEEGEELVEEQGRIHSHQLRMGGQGRKCAFSHFSTRV